MTRTTKIGLVFALTACATSIAYAQMKPEAAIRARQSIMRVIAMNFGPIAQMAQGKTAFNKGVFAANAYRIEALWAMNPGRFFAAGTDKPVAGSKIGEFTDVKAEIWSNAAKFKEANDAMGKAVAALASAAQSGDEGAMKKAAGGLGKACKGCHDDFRVKH